MSKWTKALWTSSLKLGVCFALAAPLYAQAPGMPQTPQAPRQAPRQDQAAPQADQTNQQTSPDTSANAADSGAAPEGASAASSAMLGRADFFNRFNIFDAMTAKPQTQIWTSFQYVQGFNNGLKEDPNGLTHAKAFLANGGNEYLYRLGFEYALSCNFSVAVQGQYVSSSDTNDGSFIDNPQVLAKWAFINDECNVVSATLGYEFNFSSGNLRVVDQRQRLFPGVLAYRSLGEELFIQGGYQFGVPLGGNDPYTFDWAISIGDHIYRCKDEGAFITSITPIIEVYGAHVLADRRVQNINGITADQGGMGTTVSGVEGRNIFDMTVGGTIGIGCNLNLSAGYSFPIAGTTGGTTRQNEFLTTISWKF